MSIGVDRANRDHGPCRDDHIGITWHKTSKPRTYFNKSKQKWTNEVRFLASSRVKSSVRRQSGFLSENEAIEHMNQ